MLAVADLFKRVSQPCQFDKIDRLSGPRRSGSWIKNPRRSEAVCGEEPGSSQLKARFIGLRPEYNCVRDSSECVRDKSGWNTDEIALHCGSSTVEGLARLRIIEPNANVSQRIESSTMYLLNAILREDAERTEQGFVRR